MSTNRFSIRHANDSPRGRSGRSRRRGKQDQSWNDDGDTLIEILVTIVIVGLTIAAFMGTFVTVMQGSVQHRQLATNDIIAKDFAESATNQIELAASSIFVPCASFSGTATTTSHIVYGSTPLNYQPTDTAYTIKATSIAYMDNNSVPQSLTYCQSSLDQYLPQLLQVKVLGPKGSSATLSFVVTDPGKVESYWPTTTTIPTTTTTTTTVPTSTTTTPTSTTTTIPQTIRVSGMTGVPVGTNSAWYALVTVTVEDQKSQPIIGVLVTGTWTTDVTSFITSCTTDSNGKCTVYDGQSQQLGPSDKETFTVTGLSLLNYSYKSAANSPNPPAVKVTHP